MCGKTKKWIRWTSAGTFAVGCLLLALNVSGWFIPLRNPEILSEPDVFLSNGITLSYEEVREVIAEDTTNRKQYVRNLNQAIHDGMAHYWKRDGRDKYRIRIPAWENYLLALAARVRPEKFGMYEFMDYRRALKRGVGLCSQYAIAMAKALRAREISARVIGLDGHVVVTARVSKSPEEWWLLDPDYGVVIPYDIETVEEDPAIVAPYYREAGYSMERVAELVGLYGPEGNVHFDGPGARYYALTQYRIERLAYVLIWLIPVFLMLPAAVRWAGSSLMSIRDAADNSRHRQAIH